MLLRTRLFNYKKQLFVSKYKSILITKKHIIFYKIFYGGVKVMAADWDCTKYVVGRQDSLSDILRRFGVSIKDLSECNREKNLLALKEGDTLLIRNAPHDPEKNYLLKEDETLLSVAQKLNISALKLLKANPDFMPYEIKQGIWIALPDF